MSPTFLIYGAYGFTGELAARAAVERGARPILAGRDPAALGRLSGELGLPVRAFALDDPAAVRAGLAGIGAILHCAGPFVRTSRPVVEACLATGVHYLDITGEIGVFESIFARHRKAQDAGVALLPGVGFDVVPSDSLAARLAAALPGAGELDLAFHSEGGSWSRGTLKTMIEALPAAGAMRRDSRLVPLHPAAATRSVAFSCGSRRAVTIPWGDLATAWRSTGIPTIRTWVSMPPAAIARLRRLRFLLPLLGWGPVKRRLQRAVDRRAPGPDAAARERGRMYLWGRAQRPSGEAVTATLETPEGYAFTATAAVECTLRVLAGAVPPGAWTPSQAFGADFAGELPGVTVRRVVPATIDGG